ncbi:hypothetical protein EK599_22390 [Vibrio sp. T187]|uniref:hypothetical protein n=1 Tax=Vibrio TaxID=662 RepID=UPI0010CA0873|nr:MULTISPECIES: hypothetical protein [Vibrio]MBW3698430.1 hypothetical protein [Vibrio sp. T187]
MFKKNLLTMSVAVTLAACGGSGDGDSSSSASDSVSLTAFDGYLKNALMFVDLNDDGVFNANDDTLLGLTDENGQVNVGSTKPSGTLAIQTLVLGEAAQSYLASIDSKYEHVFTVDMDRPSQPLDSEFVLRSPNSSNTISPLSDLVYSEMSAGTTQNPITEEQALTSIRNALGLNTDADLYKDFVSGEGADATLHKIAQILTASKVANPSSYGQKAKEFAQDAKQAVDGMTDEQKRDPNFRAPVNGDPTDVETPSYQTYVDETISQQVQQQFDQLALSYGQTSAKPVTFFSIDITELFKDNDLDSIDTNLLSLNTAINSSIVDSLGQEIGLIAYISTGKLNVGMNSTDAISKAGEFRLKVALAPDSQQLNAQVAIFTFSVEATDIDFPEVDENAEQILQAEINQWQLAKGYDLGEGYSIDLSSLFTAPSNETLTYSYASNAVSNGMALEGTGQGGLVVKGTPAKSASEDDSDYTILVTATTVGSAAKAVALNLPDVQDAAVPSDSLDLTHLESKKLYRVVTNKYVDVTYCEVLKLANGTMYRLQGEVGEKCPSQEPSEIVGQYSMADSKLYAYNDKYPQHSAIGRELVSNILDHEVNDKQVQRYLVSNGLTPESEFNAIQYYDEPITVNRLVAKLYSYHSDFYRAVELSAPISGEYHSLNMIPVLYSDRAEIIITRLGGNLNCQQLTSVYSKFEFGEITYVDSVAEYAEQLNVNVADICTSFELPVDIGNDFVKLSVNHGGRDEYNKYAYGLLPDLEDDSAPQGLRILEYRDWRASND